MRESEAYDVIVIGGGHAGCEAALAAARLGVRTLMITMRRDRMAAMPCNPSIGGIAKSHLVFELDALGGEMARNADYTGIQFRVLNTRKGPAVRANRAQCDKAAYSRRMQAVVESTRGLEVLEDEVTSLIHSHGAIKGVCTARNGSISACNVVISAGTSLQGTLHIGNECEPGGGGGLPASNALADALRREGFRMARLKTGTPPRLEASSIDWARMTVQPGIEPPPFFSWEAPRARDMFHVEQSGERPTQEAMFHVEHQLGSTRMPWVPGADQTHCHLTHTTDESHQIIRDNLDRSAMYGGQIRGTGVRYCPSVEDKIVKFPEKPSHHVFVEPEGRDTSLIYPNGISNSLPRDAQRALVASIPGFEAAKLVKWAYAIEYDFVDPTECRESLETRRIEGLYLAGQVLGTTGYEEAAALGFMAGVNAARRARREAPVILMRDEAYIGVLIDDLVTKGTDEPYRMFTSRAEYRLLLRQDNARFRLLTIADALGLSDGAFRDETRRYANLVVEERIRMRSKRTQGILLEDVLRKPGATYDDLGDSGCALPDAVIEQVSIDVRYGGYIERERRIVARQRELESRRIPAALDYTGIAPLRLEAREKLARVAPETLGQASRIPGITPADISVLMVVIERAMQESKLDS